MVVDGNRGEWVLKLNKLLYILNQASLNWCALLKNGLQRRVYHKSQVDRCVFYIKY